MATSRGFLDVGLGVVSSGRDRLGAQQLSPQEADKSRKRVRGGHDAASGLLPKWRDRAGPWIELSAANAPVVTGSGLALRCAPHPHRKEGLHEGSLRRHERVSRRDAALR